MSKPKLHITCEAANNKAVVKIEGYISNWDSIAARVKAAVDDLVNKGVKDLEVYINSPGGSVFEANEIVNVLARFEGSKTAMLGALCASAATRIACACDKVIAAANTSYMIHKPWTVVDGNADQIEAQLKQLRNLQKEYAQAYARKTGMSVTEIEALWKEDYWMDAAEAEEKGFIDEVDDRTAALSVTDIQAVQDLGYKHIPQLAATATTPKPQPQPNAHIMKKLLVPILAAFVAGLTEDSNDAQFIAAIEGLKTKAAKADELANELGRVTKEKKDAEINAVLQSAQDKRQITASQVEYYRVALEGNFEATKKHIEGLPAVNKATTITGTEGGAGRPAGGEDRSAWKYSDYQDKDPQALAELAEKDPDKFEELFKAHYGTKRS